MDALVLEGGGAKGAYEAGVLKALEDNGLKFRAVSASSIGSLNAGFYLSRDAKALWDFWENLNVYECFEKEIADFVSSKDDMNFSEKFKVFSKIIKDKGVNTSFLKNVLEDRLSFDKILENSDYFYISTFNLSNLKGELVEVRDIGEEKLTDYLIASSSFLFLKKKEIEGDTYLDGAFSNNLPFEIFLEKEDVDRIFIIEIEGIGIKNILPKDSKKTIYNIKASEELTKSYDFSKESIKRSMDLGYKDASAFLKSLK